MQDNTNDETKTATPEQLTLLRQCKACGSEHHDDCGYDPETVRPSMTIARALSECGLS